MAPLPEKTSLGSLRVVEIFAEHDFPVLFACKNTADQLYLATWISESEESTGWLYSAISPVRLGKLRRQVMPVRDVFTVPEAGSVLRVEIPKSGGSATTTTLTPSQLSDDMLPESGATVEESEPVGDQIATELLDSSDDAEIVIDGDPVVNHGVRADFFGSLMRAVQDLTTSLGQTADDLASGASATGGRIAEIYQLFVQPTFTPSSFKFRLKVSTGDEGPPAGGEVQTVLDAVSQSLALDSTVANNAALFGNQRVRSKYAALLKLLSRKGAVLTLRTRGNPYGVRLTSQQARNRIEKSAKPKRDRKTLLGTLDGGSLGRDRFELVVGETIYRGKNSVAAKQKLRTIALGSRVSATIDEITRVGKDSGDVKTRYVLTDVSLDASTAPGGG